MIETLCTMHLKKMVYISCNVSTLAPGFGSFAEVYQVEITFNQWTCFQHGRRAVVRLVKRSENEQNE